MRNIGQDKPIYINYNAEKITSYIPTGIFIINDESYIITGGQISSIEDISGILSYNVNPFTIYWKSSELSSFINPTINYIMLSEQTYNNYKLISGEVDPWKNYYAKYYHNLAVGVLTGGCLDDPLLSAKTTTNTNGVIHAKEKSTYPLYQYFSMVLSSQINNALTSNSVKSYNLNTNLSGLYTMVNEIGSKYNRSYNTNNLFLYKLIFAYDSQSSVKRNNYVFEDRSSDTRHAYVYYGASSTASSSTNSKYNPIVSSVIPTANSKIYNSSPIIKYIGHTNSNYTQNMAYQCYQSDGSKYYWSTVTSSGFQYTRNIYYSHKKWC